MSVNETFEEDVLMDLEYLNTEYMAIVTVIRVVVAWEEKLQFWNVSE